MMEAIRQVAARVNYDPETGVISWRERELSDFASCKNPNAIWASWNAKCAGKPVTRKDSNGYIRISFKRKELAAHRVAFFIIHGYCPATIDHINGNRCDNAAINLRAATLSENALNRSSLPSHNRSGKSGVHWVERDQLWCARIRKGGRVVFCKYSKSMEVAISARRAAEAALGIHCNA